ncbi:MAG: GIY-YIG nuclease family protein [Patescibacteria group bacterium]
MTCFVYIIKCADGTLYTGITWNLGRRIREHNLGLARSSFTKGRLPVELMYWEKFDSRELAARREKEIKGWGRRKKETLISSLHRGAPL